jgi:hypothetical protein
MKREVFYLVGRALGIVSLCWLAHSDHRMIELTESQSHIRLTATHKDTGWWSCSGTGFMGIFQSSHITCSLHHTPLQTSSLLIGWTTPINFLRSSGFNTWIIDWAPSTFTPFLLLV